MQIIGLDVSHYQGIIDWEKVKQSKQFAIIKCTEGKSNLDSFFVQNKENARKAGLLCGYYHFSDGGDYKDEADNFLSSVGNLEAGEFVCLDYEIMHGNDVEWCKNWLSYVEEKLGFKPMIYCPAGNGLDWSPVASYGLWISRYGLNKGDMELNYPPNIGKWQFYAIWQFTSTGQVDGINGNVDLDAFSGTLEQLKEYGKPEPVVTTLEAPTIPVIPETVNVPTVPAETPLIAPQQPTIETTPILEPTPETTPIQTSQTSIPVDERPIIIKLLQWLESLFG
jgi:GH25 family lysozyme M1 (1,4-beta-N-acetylmuramidase)